MCAWWSRQCEDHTWSLCSSLMYSKHLLPALFLLLLSCQAFFFFFCNTCAADRHIVGGYISKIQINITYWFWTEETGAGITAVLSDVALTYLLTYTFIHSYSLQAVNRTVNRGVM